MAARTLRPLQEFDPSASRELLPLHSCRLASLGPKVAFLGMLRRKGRSGWGTHETLHGSGVSGKPHPVHRSLFLSQVHYEVLGRGSVGLGGAQNHPEFLKDQGILEILQPPPTLILPYYR